MSFYITIRHIHPPQQILQHGVGGEERSLPRAARTRQDQQVSAVVAPPLIPGSGPTPDPSHVAWPGLLSGAGTASSSPPAPHFLSQPPPLRQLQERILGLRAGRNPGDFQVSSFSVRQIGVTGGYRLVSTWVAGRGRTEYAGGHLPLPLILKGQIHLFMCSMKQERLGKTDLAQLGHVTSLFTKETEAQRGKVTCPRSQS